MSGGGFTENLAPGVRVDPHPPTLARPSGLTIRVISLHSWDVFKLAIASDEPGASTVWQEEKAVRPTTTYDYEPTRSGVTYAVTAQGCSKTADGATPYCSPVSAPVRVRVTNTASLRDFLLQNGVSDEDTVSLRERIGRIGMGLRAVMCV